MAILRSDSCARADSISLGDTDDYVASTLGPATWVGNWSVGEEIASNRIHLFTTASVNQVAYVDVGTAVIQILCDVAPNAIIGGLCARLSDNSNFICAFAHPSTGTLEIYKIVAGSGTQLASVSHATTGGVEYPMTLTCTAANLITFTANGGQVSVTDSFNSSATKAGLFHFGVATPGSKFRNFIAQDPVVASGHPTRSRFSMFERITNTRLVRRKRAL